MARRQYFRHGPATVRAICRRTRWNCARYSLALTIGMARQTQRRLVLVSVQEVSRVGPAGLFAAGSVGDLPRCPRIVAASPPSQRPKSLAGPPPPDLSDGHLVSEPGLPAVR